jgi:arylsulfatase
MEDPFHPIYPLSLKDKVGPRNLLHPWATNVDDPTGDPRWGKVGKQKIEDEGPLPPHPTPGIKYNMETVDDVILEHTLQSIDTSRADGKPFFVWLNPTRMHVVTHLSEKYQKMRTPENGGSIEEAGMAQLDDIVGSVMEKLKDAGLDDNTIVVFRTDNGTENFTRPDGGQTPLAARGLSSKEVSAFSALFAGQGTYRRAKSKKESSPALTGSQLSSQRPVIRTLSMS